jgi:hypothetical protein
MNHEDVRAEVELAMTDPNHKMHKAYLANGEQWQEFRRVLYAQIDGGNKPVNLSNSIHVKGRPS